MQVFYVNIGGGEPTVRPDFWELVDYATAHHVGREVLHERPADHARGGQRSWPAATTSTCRSPSTARLPRSTTPFAAAARSRWPPAPCRTSPTPGSRGFKISVVMTRHNVAQLDAFKPRSRTRFGAQLRITRLRPSGRGADVWDELHPTAAQQRELYDWLVAHGENVLTGDSFFHLAGYGQELPGLNMCGAGRVVCLIDPVGDVYACPFAIHDGVPGRERARARRIRRRCGGARSCSPACGSRSRAAPARRARRSTRARAGAWRPSSSPGCRWTGPTPSACAASARLRSRPPAPRRRRARPATTHTAARLRGRVRAPRAGAGLHRAAAGPGASPAGAGPGRADRSARRAGPGLRREPARRIHAAAGAVTAWRSIAAPCRADGWRW